MDNKTVLDKKKLINAYGHGLGSIMTQMIPLFFPPPYPSTRPTAIPSFHPNISLFHRRHQSSSMPPSMSSVKYILATKSSSLPVVLTDGWWQILWRLVSYGWQQMELRRREVSFHGSPSSVFLPRSPPSFFFVVALYENEKATSYRPEFSPSSSLFHCRATMIRSFLYELFLARSTSLLLLAAPSPAASQCTLVIRHDERGDTGANMIQSNVLAERIKSARLMPNK